MKKRPTIKTLFLDIGGVLLSNGWDHLARHRAAEHFGLDFGYIEERHQIVAAAHEEDKLSLSEYFTQVYFDKPRAFTRSQLRAFMFAQSTPVPEMIALATRLKAKYRLNITIVSNEARELNAYRIRKFKLDRFVDSFICSCFVGIRKPDRDMFRLAIDISHSEPGRVVYIENTAMFARIAEDMGINCILHTDYTSTREKLSVYDLPDD